MFLKILLNNKNKKIVYLFNNISGIKYLVLHIILYLFKFKFIFLYQGYYKTNVIC